MTIFSVRKVSSRCSNWHVVMVSSSCLCVLFYLLQCGMLVRAHQIPTYLQDIREHRDDVQRIKEYILHGSGKHQTYDKVANITDMFGPRISGSQALENASDYLMRLMEKEGLDNVHSESVQVPYWVRGEEVVKVLQPRDLDLEVLGLGGTVGTNGSDVVADVIVVHSFEELKRRQNEVAGKIVVYNQGYDTYSTSRVYRTHGASYASQYGAVAALIRSITDFSISSPHTGAQMYWKNVTKIPALCITAEDAETFSRWQKAGVTIQVSISSTSHSHGKAWSKNVMGEIVGTDYPDQVVVFGGHIDSWDVGTGAMDDIAEVIMSWQVLSVIKALGLKPKRTMRILGWTAEEIGLQGAKEYYKQHQEEANFTSLMMETDSGLFMPVENIKFKGSQEAISIIQAISDLLGDRRLPVVEGGAGADISPWKPDGVPTLSLNTDNKKYFYYHHSKGDTISVYTPEELDECTILWTVLAYVVSDLDDLLPRETSELYHMYYDVINSGIKTTINDSTILIGNLLIVIVLSKMFYP